MHPFFKWLLTLFMATVAVVLYSQPSHAQNVKTYIHPKAIPLVPVFKSELQQVFPHIPEPWYVMGLTEHESCVSLRAAKCWSSTSELNTKWKNGNRRERGAGLPQLTAAWRENGVLRMDTLSALKKAYPKELQGLTWDNILTKPDLQIRAQVLLLRDDYKNLHVFKDPLVRLQATDSAYNGGRRDVLGARKVCGLTSNCDPSIWFNHVEKHCVKSKKAMYGNRSPCDINTHHVRDVFFTRMPKFKPLLPSLD